MSAHEFVAFGSIKTVLMKKGTRSAQVPIAGRIRADTAGQIHFVYPGQKFATPKVRAFIETALKTA